MDSSLINWGVIGRQSAFHFPQDRLKGSLGNQLILMMFVVPALLHAFRIFACDSGLNEARALALPCGTKRMNRTTIVIVSFRKCLVRLISILFNPAPVSTLLERKPTSMPHSTQTELLNRKVTRVPRLRHGNIIMVIIHLHSTSGGPFQGIYPTLYTIVQELFSVVHYFLRSLQIFFDLDLVRRASETLLHPIQPIQGFLVSKTPLVSSRRLSLPENTL
jgi:hypothetical protein